MIIMIVELCLFYLRLLSFSFSTTSRASLTVKPISINGFTNSDMFISTYTGFLYDLSVYCYDLVIFDVLTVALKGLRGTLLYMDRTVLL